MIDRIRGRLEEVLEESALVDLGGLVLEASVPPVDRPRLLGRLGQVVELYTVALLQGGVGGASLTPVLIGFLAPEEREFWLKLSGAGGLGQRTALRAMSLPVATIARAIEAGDEAWLTQLPGIGRQRAADLVARLRGKVAGFAFAAPAPGAGGGAAEAGGPEGPGSAGAAGKAGAGTGSGEGRRRASPGSAAAGAGGGAGSTAGAGQAAAGPENDPQAVWAEALQVLEQLGHAPAEAMAMLERVVAGGATVESVDQLIREAYRQAAARLGGRAPAP
ncbi:MAG: hypothetical protein QJR14_10900 [Bacillota bacterium]|nr:hypothetical protein [Bacillota bacterium]